MVSYIFIALICTATSAWNGACQSMHEVRIENLTKDGCDAARKSYSTNYRVKQIDCLEQRK